MLRRIRSALAFRFSSRPHFLTASLRHHSVSVLHRLVYDPLYGRELPFGRGIVACNVRIRITPLPLRKRVKSGIEKATLSRGDRQLTEETNYLTRDPKNCPFLWPSRLWTYFPLAGE